MSTDGAADGAAFDLVGVGFGPSGIGLAAAIDDAAEANGGRSPVGRVCFVERAASSAWHGGMLLAETDIQHHFLRDLATPRDPRSRFTFANYLKEKGRLYEFGELALGASGGAVSRLEWSDYVEWVAARLRDYVRYETELVEVRPVREGTSVDRVDLVTTSGDVTARALVLCSGRTPLIPAEWEGRLGPTVFHSSGFRSAVECLDRDRPLRVAVIGSGQSAVEILNFLHSAFPSTRLVSIHRTLGFRHVDLSQFSNEIFHPAHVDFFHALGAEQRRAVLREARSTNFGVVDAEAADVLYRKLYEDMVRGVLRLEVVTNSSVTAVSTAPSGHRLRIDNVLTGERMDVDVDLVVLCTGYREAELPPALEPLAEFVERDEEGNPRVLRDYRLAARDELAVPIYLSGMSERTHGASDSASFSMVALRAKAILDSLVARARRAEPA